MDAQPPHDPRRATEAGTPVRRRGRVRRLGAWYRRHVWPATALLALLVLLAGFVALQAALNGRIAGGVSAGGVELGGLTKAEARDALAGELTPKVSAVRLETPGEPLSLTLDQLAMAVDEPATVAAAYARGRHRLPGGLEVWLPGGGGEVAAVLTVDQDSFGDAVEAVRELVDVPATDARLDLAGDGVKVVPAQDGVEVDAVALKRAIEASVAAGRAYAGPVPTRPAPPKVSTAEAESRAGAAAAYLARPLTLRYRDRTVVLEPSALAGLLSVNKGADAADYPLTFRNDRARAALRKLFAFAERPPVDARIIVGDDGTVSITESRDGEVLDLQVLLEDMDDAAAGGALRSVHVTLRPVAPTLSTEEAGNMGLASLGSQFTTYFDVRNVARATNIARAAALVDGAVVAPGETFSLNAAMGPRTTNRGFDYAPVIAADSVLRQGVGGGICQYATTLFNAVFFAGLPVVERLPHAFYISHYPTGRDATVAWGAIDFRFRNDTSKALMIRSWVDGGALTVAIVGKTGREVQYTTSAFYDIRKPAYTKADPRVVYDADLGPGVVRWERGVEGRSVKVVRTVRRSNGTVHLRDTFVSVYRPMDWIKRVGT